MEAITLFLGLTVICFLLFNTMFTKQKSKFPPGPRGWPIFGNILSLKDEPAKYLRSMANIYGPIFSIHLGRTPVVVIDDLDEMREILKRKETAGRPTEGVFAKLTAGNGVVISTGPKWISSRKLLLQYFRESGKDRIEYAVNEELKQVRHHLDKACGSDGKFDMAPLLIKATYNIVNCFCFGKLYDYDDEEFKQNIEIFEEVFKLVNAAKALFAMKPWTNILMNRLEQKVVKLNRPYRKTVKRIIEEHTEAYQRNKDSESDFMYSFLDAADKEKEETGGNEIYTSRQLEELSIDILAAGTETTAATLRWLLYFLKDEPGFVQKIQNEIDANIGSSRPPTMDDKPNLPFTNACIQEAERLGSVAHLAVIHTCLENFKYKGYELPKGTSILYNIWSTHNDKNQWKNPQKYDPYRFIDEDDQVFRPSKLIPFGVGRRMCPGEVLATIEIFLFTVTLFQNFNFSKVSNKSGNLSENGLARVPERFELHISKRNRSQ